MHRILNVLLCCVLGIRALSTSTLERSTDCDSLCFGGPGALCAGDLQNDEKCRDACRRACEGVPHSYSRDDIYFSTRIAFELPPGEIITGGDAPVAPLNHDYYFTTRNGKLYHYVTSDSPTNGLRLTELLQLNKRQLNTRNGKGLYSVAVDRKYAQNNRLYLAYATNQSLAYSSVVEPKIYYIPDPANSDLFSTLTVNHYTVVQEVTLNGPQAQLGPIIREIEQFSPDSVGHWMGALHEDMALHGPANRLLVAVGGNPGQDGLLAVYASHLSSMTVMVPKPGGIGTSEEPWSSAIRRPVDCSASGLSADVVHCLLESEDLQGSPNGTILYALKRGVNYGSADFRRHCSQNKLACKQRINDLMNRDGLIRFPHDECAVRSVHVYTGPRSHMPSLHNQVLVTRDSCYSARTGSIREAELLYVDYNSAYGVYSATPLKLYLEHRFLTNVKLLGADGQATLLLSGVSLSTGKTVVQELIPEKAGQFLAFK